MLILTGFLGVSLVCSWVYYLLCLDSARIWKSRAATLPNAQHLTPAVSILKPLRGSDPEQLANFESFCRQEYPSYEILFGALDADDPGLDSARRVAASFPDRGISIIEGGEVFGANRKVCNLEALFRHARY